MPHLPHGTCRESPAVALTAVLKYRLSLPSLTRATVHVFPYSWYLEPRKAQMAVSSLRATEVAENDFVTLKINYTSENRKND